MMSTTVDDNNCTESLFLQGHKETAWNQTILLSKQETDSNLSFHPKDCDFKFVTNYIGRKKRQEYEHWFQYK